MMEGFLVALAVFGVIGGVLIIGAIVLAILEIIASGYRH